MADASSLRFSGLEIREQGGLSASLALDPEAFASVGTEGLPAGEVKVALEFSVGSSDILLTGSATGAARYVCARCLKPFEARFDLPLERTYPVDSEWVDAWDELREAWVVEQPLRPLCRPDCKGLCAVCGKDLNEGDCGHKPDTGGSRPRIRKKD